MAFSIKQIKAILSEHGLSVDELEKTAEEICSRHTADLDSIKEERDKYQKDAETLVSVQAELDKLKKDPYEVKYNALKEEYDQYKADIKAKETKEKTTEAYRELLKEAGVSEKRREAVLKVSDLSKVKFDAQGAVEGKDALIQDIKTEWADFIATEGTQGANPANPPKNNPGERPGSTGRAKQLAAQYHAALYGATKEEK